MIIGSDNKKWYTYVDWTCESSPRPFYVGKGKLARVKDITNRNIVWHRIAKKYGYCREIVFSSEKEKECFEKEQELILSLKTYQHLESGWGANLCMGGNGPTGVVWNLDSKQKLSQSIKTLWINKEYRDKLISKIPTTSEQLEHDGMTMSWDDLASKYNVSATTIKRWFREHRIKKSLKAASRKSWSESDLIELIFLYESGMSVRTIALKLSRSECSIKKKIQVRCKFLGIKRSRYRKCLS